MDRELRKIMSSVPGRPRVALIATGGYGRCELAPFSDIDVMFFAPDRTDTGAAEEVLYRLWDLDCEISHSFRTPAECIEEAFSDVKTRTSLLEARFIAGDAGLFQSFRDNIYPEIAYRRQKEFVQEKLIEMGKRHHDAGSSVFLLEPHIKEGEGGLRDIHTAYWLSKVALRKETFDDFLGMLRKDERRRFLSAYDFLLKVRFGLHLESGRRNDILSFEYQEAVAARTGFRNSKKFSGTERLLRYFYLKSGAIRDIARSVMSRCSSNYVPVLRDLSVRKVTEAFSLSGGRIIMRRPDLLAREPERVIEAFQVMSQTGRKFSPALKEAVRANLLMIRRGARSSSSAVNRFLEILRSERVYETLSRMHDAGVLGRFIPEFGALRMLVVHEPYHLYTVDQHSLTAVRNLENLRSTPYGSLHDLRTIMREVRRPDVLYMAILFHDIGKAAGRHHEEEGYKRLKNIMDRFNLDVGRRMRIEFLVRNHILMSRMALRREAADPEVIAAFADAVGDQENLKALYLITYADMSAVNPGFWSGWKAHLLRDLFERTLAHLTGIRKDRAAFIRELIASAPDIDERALTDFIGDMPERYLLSAAPREIIHDYQLMGRVREGGFALRIEVNEAVAELSISAEDCPGLFSRIVGFLSARGLNIVSGRIFTGHTGMVIDKITVSNWRAVWWEGFEEDLHRGLRAIIVDDEPVHTERRPLQAAVPYGVFVELDNEASEDSTVIEIFSPDRMGLLYDVSRCMYEKGINILSARIMTESGLAQDVFYVQKKKAKMDYADTENILAGLWAILKG